MEREPDFYLGELPVYVDERVPRDWNHGMVFIPAGVNPEEFMDAAFGPDEPGDGE